MPMTVKILMAIVTGLVGAALLHVIIILSLPNFTGQDAYTRVMRERSSFRFHLLGKNTDSAGLSSEDPFMRMAVCSWDSEKSPVRLNADGDVAFWSVSIYDSGANEIFSMNDRTSVNGVLDVLIATPAQLARLRRAPPEALERSIMVETVETSGYAILRTMAPQLTLENSALDFLSIAECMQYR